MVDPFPSSRRREIALGFLLVALVTLAYVGSLRGEFLWDDDLHITANPTIIGPLGLKEIWTTSRANYFPLVLTNFWAQHALWGVDPFGYRVVTLAFHAFAGVLLWRVLRQLRVPGAWLGAALWALHPVQVESVAWICELKNTQSAVFFLAALGFWVRWVRLEPSPPSTAAKGASRAARSVSGADVYALAFVCALLAILSKPSTVMLPPVLGLCAWWLRGRVTRRDVIALVPFFTLSALAAGWTIWEQKFHSGAIGEAWNQTLPERIAIAGRVLWFYLGKLVWPEPLMFIYPRWEISAAGLLGGIPAVAALVGLGILWWKRASRWKPVFFAAVYFAALLFPVLGFFSVYFFRYSFVGDHFQYLASMGPLALAAAGLTVALRQAPPALVRAAPFAGGLLVVALALLSWRHAANFRSNVTLWQSTVARNPTCLMAWLNLGDHYTKLRQYEASVATFRHALTLSPDDVDGHNDLGGVLLLLGRTDEGLVHLQRAAALQPNRAEMQNNLGNAVRQAGRRDEAIGYYRRALELKPNYPEAHNNLGVELAELGRHAEALPHLETALAATPDNARTHANLANVLRHLRRPEEALRHYETALRLQPGQAEVHYSVGTLFVEQGRLPEARAQFERALQLKPDLALAHSGLAHLLATGGRLSEALPHFESAARFAPDFAPAHENLGTAFSAMQRWADAIPPLRQAVQIDPNLVPARVKLGVACVNAGQLEAAVPQFEAALRLQPDSAETHNFLGQTLRALGRDIEAASHLARASVLRRP